MRIFPLILSLGVLASSAGIAAAQSRPVLHSAPPQRLPTLPQISPGNRVSPFGHDGVFPSHRFISELAAYETTRLASYGHTKEVDAANDASRLIDRGDCSGAEALLRARGETAMAARVAPTCEAKRQGVI